MERKGLGLVLCIYEFRAVWRLKTELIHHFRYFPVPVPLVTKLKSWQSYFQWFTEELLIFYTGLAGKLKE